MRHLFNFKLALIFLLATVIFPIQSRAASPHRESFPIANNKYYVVLDVSEVPELAAWARQTLIPVVQDWYPKIIALLPSPNYSPPKSFTITFKRDMPGIANTAGTRITAAGAWYQQHLQDQAVGSIVHELVHVVQQYGDNHDPGWLVEGIADYIRFYLFEPQVHGADISPRGAAKVRYDDSYRVTANFLNWVTAQGNPSLIVDLNAEMRRGHYNDKLWLKLTGRSLQRLADSWQLSLLAQQ